MKNKENRAKLRKIGSASKENAGWRLASMSLLEQPHAQSLLAFSIVFGIVHACATRLCMQLRTNSSSTVPVYKARS